jgi:hypothetical protein
MRAPASVASGEPATASAEARNRRASTAVWGHAGGRQGVAAVLGGRLVARKRRREREIGGPNIGSTEVTKETKSGHSEWVWRLDAPLWPSCIRQHLRSLSLPFSRIPVLADGLDPYPRLTCPARARFGSPLLPAAPSMSLEQKRADLVETIGLLPDSEERLAYLLSRGGSSRRWMRRSRRPTDCCPAASPALARAGVSRRALLLPDGC